jgi:hypothetical protein
MFMAIVVAMIVGGVISIRKALASSTVQPMRSTMTRKIFVPPV